MTPPLKQLKAFTNINDVNAWLSARENDRYATRLHFNSTSFFCIMEYWEEQS